MLAITDGCHDRRDSMLLVPCTMYSLSTFMRRFLTGYATSYNKRQFRHGNFLQNRYKSIVCQEDAYFQELVRYIHLNPLRAQLVSNLSELDSYPWAGHSVIVGRICHEWQDRKYVLSWFGRSEDEAQKAYRTYIHAGVDQVSRPELVGGGLIRSLGGWSQVISARKHGDRDLPDERILGDAGFVDQVIREADDRLSSQFEGLARKQKTQEIIQKICDQENINVLVLKAGSRRRSACRVRSQVAHELVETYGIPLVEVARHVGVSYFRHIQDVAELINNYVNEVNDVPYFVGGSSGTSSHLRREKGGRYFQLDEKSRG